MNLEDNFQGSSLYNAAARFVLTELDDLGAELLTDVQIGSDTKIASEFYQPLNASRLWFVAPSAEGRNTGPVGLQQRTSRWRISATGRRRPTSISGGRSAIGARSAWAIHRTNGATRDRLGDPGLVETQYNLGEYFFKFSYDRLDNVHFPRDGQTFTCSGMPIAPIWVRISRPTRSKPIG